MTNKTIIALAIIAAAILTTSTAYADPISDALNDLIDGLTDLQDRVTALEATSSSNSTLTLLTNTEFDILASQSGKVDGVLRQGAYVFYGDTLCGVQATRSLPEAGSNGANAILLKFANTTSVLDNDCCSSAVMQIDLLNDVDQTFEKGDILVLGTDGSQMFEVFRELN